ncbi:MAG TPA: sodium-dependent transporter, partial [Ruminococcaceae bacterium]|nr:sodium-dependent transporter [Oscillospiraceae bacterium]
FFDFVSNSVLMPLVAFLTCIFVVWFVGLQSIVDEVKLSSRFKQEKMFCVMIRYIAPVCIILILVSSVLNSLGVIKI